MKRLEITGIDLVDFDKRIEIALTKSFQAGVQHGKTTRSPADEFLDKTELMARWKCSDETISKYEKKYSKNFKRTIIGTMIRYRVSMIEKFEKLIDRKTFQS